ncbi:2-keto-4-pentenoate hydratase [Aurantimonas sp. DM33-3]|uniref:2-keto-4-pentenoate hydratase n=1 Tax=Aurantimonas sp. DM33-3 TaxID=2766955 RepID=UPI001651CC58|nr:2-keto-4-pentenoate hydratase [Aurantimonas sp. DM33-3]MBC6716282.1 2-keto-4-pentenoate hydratase [Aurantimonas sp. DM33-3]
MADDTTPAEALATALIAARRSHAPMPRSEADRLAGMIGPDGAYAVQQLVCEAFGPVAAWKTGRKRVADPVIAAPVLEGGLRASGASFSTGELGACGVELEIGFRLDRPLPPFDTADFEALARDCVTPLAVIEMVDGRIDGFMDAAPLAKLADNQSNGGLVFGTQVNEGTLDLTEPEVRLTFDGREVVTGRQKVPGGDAFSVFLAFARMVGDHCGGLQLGQIVTTGTLSGLPFVAPGTVIEGWISGLGPVRTAFVEAAAGDGQDAAMSGQRSSHGQRSS